MEWRVGSLGSKGFNVLCNLFLGVWVNCHDDEGLRLSSLGLFTRSFLLFLFHFTTSHIAGEQGVGRCPHSFFHSFLSYFILLWSIPKERREGLSVQTVEYFGFWAQAGLRYEARGFLFSHAVMM